jgi:hypothetical protein
MNEVFYPLIDQGSSGWDERSYLGTAFTIGLSGTFGLTAKHCVTNATKPAALLFTDGQWEAVPLERVEGHDTADLAVFQLGTGQREAVRSPIYRPASGVDATTQYCLWGYPKDLSLEDVEGRGVARFVPTLVYSEGHVRRRTASRIRSQDQLLELSHAAGSGCSGAPVFARSLGRPTVENLAGIYVGEHEIDGRIVLGHAVPIDTFAEWKPRLLGHSTADELSTTVGIP